MEYSIDVSSFNKEKLEELRKILEENRINEIKNDMKDKGIITIKYSKKEIELNEKFYFKVKLIRDKYYRQVLNLINSVDKITFFNKGTYTFFSKSDLSLCEIDSRIYTDILKMALINYIGTYNFDDIFELDKDDMLDIIKKNKTYYSSDNNDNENYYRIRALGMYCHCNSELLRKLKSKDEISEDIKNIIDRLEKCNRFILICQDLINEFCIDNFKKFKQYGITDTAKLCNIIFNKVLVHEIGHGVFDYIRDSDDEKRANYFVSLTFDGTIDRIIKTMTDIQGGEYKNPYLIDDDNIKDKVYKIV